MVVHVKAVKEEIQENRNRDKFSKEQFHKIRQPTESFLNWLSEN